MYYILFDLEWNSAKNVKTGKFVNEIIEIGAVMLDSDFNEIDSFSKIIKPTLTDQLNKYVKSLTSITEADFENSQSFKEVITEFKKWAAAHKNSIFLTWSNTDLHVLVDNYTTFLNKKSVDFLSKYCDLQKYASRFIKSDLKNQVSLSAAAEYFKIDTSVYSLHRALDDSRVCADILKVTYDEKILDMYVTTINKADFYKRLSFKPYYITKLDNPLVDKQQLSLSCPHCKNKTRQLDEFNFKYKVFSSVFVCDKCKNKYQLSVKFKKTFDNVVVSRTIRTFDKKLVNHK